MGVGGKGQKAGRAGKAERAVKQPQPLPPPTFLRNKHQEVPYARNPWRGMMGIWAMLARGKMGPPDSRQGNRPFSRCSQDCEGFE